jgi:hypothetical protein
MGLPALRHEAPRRTPRPSLALVEESRAGTVRFRTGARTASRTQACHSARCRDTFRTFVVIAVLFSGLGVARVALASRAAALSIESGRVSAKIKEVRFEGHSLEIKISQLATPSRIRVAAGTKMKMAPATGIWYMTIPGSGGRRPVGHKPAATGSADKNVSSARAKTSGSLLSSIMHTAAGEAQVLLLGDVGLSSSR